jgi:hypothetical protein
VELADGVIEAAQGRRARAPRVHRCTGRSRTTPSAHSATFSAVAKFVDSSWVRLYAFRHGLCGPCQAARCEAVARRGELETGRRQCRRDCSMRHCPRQGAGGGRARASLEHGQTSVRKHRELTIESRRAPPACASALLRVFAMSFRPCGVA